MKIITTNLVECAVKACKSTTKCFPLHLRDTEIVETEQDFHPEFLRNIISRLDWDALRTTASEV